MENSETNTKDNITEVNNDAASAECSSEEIMDDVKNIDDEESNQEEEIIRLNKELDALRDLLQRRQADFENYKKRSIKMQEEFKKLAVKDFAFDIINVNDDIIRAIEASENMSAKNNAETKASFIEGVKLISKRIEEILNKYGIEEIESENMPFNPAYHEALEIENSGHHEEDTVTKVYQKGFKLENHIIRSAKVRVSKMAEKNQETKN
ncbi:MAG: nucleotide exchange factor GrpE [Leptospirales bacterium]|nr:nucleotide exchange factor GrpE [Leptospirales bacterium]